MKIPTTRTVVLLSWFLPFYLGGCAAESITNFSVRGSTKGPGLAPRVPLLGNLSPSMIIREGQGSPTALKVSMFSFYLSSNADCSSPILVIDYGGSPLVKSIQNDPILFSGKLPSGRYECAILVLSDNLIFQPDQTAVDAVTGCADTSTEYTHDFYRDGGAEEEHWKDLGGTEIEATGSIALPGEDKVTLFSTADVVSARSLRGLSSNQIIPLNAAIVVPGEVTFYADYTGAVLGKEGTCAIEGGIGLGIR